MIWGKPATTWKPCFVLISLIPSAWEFCLWRSRVTLCIKLQQKKKKNNKTCGCNLSDDRQSRKLVFRLFIPLLERVHEIVFLFSIAFFLGLFLFEVKAFLAGPLPIMSLQTHVDIIVQPIILTSMYSNHLQQLFTQVTPRLVIYDT